MRILTIPRVGRKFHCNRVHEQQVTEIAIGDDQDRPLLTAQAVTVALEGNRASNGAAQSTGSWLNVVADPQAKADRHY